jgi:hypothetical protein
VEAHGKPGIFQQAGEFPKLTDPEYPIAQIAADYYKNGSSFLRRYLPFWMVAHVQRLLAVSLAAAAIFIPIFNFAPKLYQWLLQNLMGKLYRRLRIIENEMQKKLTTHQVAALQTDLENINRAAKILPMRHSELFFDFNRHIEFTRERLASHLAELQRQTAKVA